MNPGILVAMAMAMAMAEMVNEYLLIFLKVAIASDLRKAP